MNPLAPLRRHLFAAALLGLGSLAAVAPLQAAAPMVKTQAPGYYRFMLGDVEITALSDGTISLPVDKILHAKPEKVQTTLKANHLSLPLETSVNAFLINTGSKLVLVDTGAGALFGPTVGKLVSHLKAAGYSPEQVDEIYITHLHGDHVGGVQSQGVLAFPKAIVRADQRDVDYWLSKENAAKAPESRKGLFQGAVASMEPLLKANRFKAFTGSTELVPGVRALSTYGHTDGHTIYVVESGGQKLYLIGDLIHVGAVQFPDPTITIDFDTHSAQAREQRLRTFATAAKEGALVGAAHISFPGLGHLKAAGKGYQWVPVNYTALNK
jgi:glyoxylase-like metal-dependent hydrolase (beta-lactamase superfamily II)